MIQKIIFTSACILMVFTYQSCSHDPYVMGGPMEGDPTVNENLCEDDVIYFEKQILPILRSNCAFSDCHDVASANDDVILESYNYVVTTADVQPFNLNDSEMYEVLVEDNLNKRMPPPPADPLSADQINLVAQWILQGAENLTCEETECNSENVSFSAEVKPLIDNHCKGCHSGESPSGNVKLDGYDNIKEKADDGRLYGAISWANGYKQMPKDQNQLDDCTLDKIKSWIDNGALNN